MHTVGIPRQEPNHNNNTNPLCRRSALMALQLASLATVLATVLAVDSFPAFPRREEEEQKPITLIEPADGTVVFAEEKGNANITLRYHLGVSGADRLCLDLRRSPLRYYRGPILNRDDSFAPYAKGCYAPGQPVTLQSLGLGQYQLTASAESSSGSRHGSATVYFAISPPPTGDHADAHDTGGGGGGGGDGGGSREIFVPAYEWQVVAPGQSIPSGLEVKLTMHKQHVNDGDAAADDEPPRYARIPSSWRLQVYAGKGVGFLRHDVRRDSSIASVEAGLRASLPMAHGELAHTHCPPRVELWRGSAEGGGERLGPAEQTAEGAALFSQRSGLSAKLVPCSDVEEADAKADADARAKAQTQAKAKAEAAKKAKAEAAEKAKAEDAEDAESTKVGAAKKAKGKTAKRAKAEAAKRTDPWRLTLEEAQAEAEKVLAHDNRRRLLEVIDDYDDDEYEQRIQRLLDQDREHERLLSQYWAPPLPPPPPQQKRNRESHLAAVTPATATAVEVPLALPLALPVPPA